MESLQEAATQDRGMRLCELGRRWLWYGGLGEGRESDLGAGGSGGGGGRGAGGGGGGRRGLLQRQASGARVCAPTNAQGAGAHWHGEQVRAEEAGRAGREFC